MKFIRNCPSCSKEITYKTSSAFNNANKKESLCQTCCKSGDKNPFFGKKHTDETKQKLIKNNLKNIDKYQTNEFKEKISNLNKGNKNPMFGKTFYEIWLDKYGEDIANNKLNKFRKKHSDNNKGEKNPMFGKPSPNGSGNGWSGWYKGTFFKSLKELCFIISLEKSGLSFISAERKKFRIEYIDWEGKKRNYYPDFFIEENKTLVECKPSHFFKSKNVLCKRKSAEKFCEENGYKYLLIDPGKLSNKDIFELYNSGNLKFIDRYDLKFKEKFYKELNEKDKEFQSIQIA